MVTTAFAFRRERESFFDRRWRNGKHFNSIVSPNFGLEFSVPISPIQFPEPSKPSFYNSEF
jgi:hypothetical protein